MISSDIMRGYNDTIILFLLLDQPSYGYEISKHIRQATREKYTIKETTLYSAFNRLAENGLIESFSGSESFGKPRTYYRITAAGRQYYQDKCQEWHLIREIMPVFIKEENPDGNHSELPEQPVC